ncbi:Tetratricopeptide repeat (TPR)-like superfamily protein isoform 1 [Dorcoceras hygrometricum]|uniref:Tetratricopeptide repeat (TPR)-like superfamily protein isoform 1 n=1 Tax=Dorcoceras hygrometricum TaxID=472368 RepID=A0A2Z7C7S2_9LAMI|nr:Tetratricopeptide repeat (TPR)-like superfamily protein isoform 1 [Dorcoceras hygrometricum]
MPKDKIFDARSIVSLTGEPVTLSGLKSQMKMHYRLLCDIMEKSISVKAGSFNAITVEKFSLLTAVVCDVKMNWGSVLFGILNKMVTPGTKQAKGFAIQISLLLESVPNLELGESSEFPSSKILIDKTIHHYITVIDKSCAQEPANAPKVKKAPKTKVASKKRPADTSLDVPVVRKMNFKPSEGSSTIDLKILDQLYDIHLFILEELKKEIQAHGLMWKKTCCSKIFEGRPRDRGAVIARTNSNTPSKCWIRTMLRVNGTWVIEPCADYWMKIPQPDVHYEISRQRQYDDTLPSNILHAQLSELVDYINRGDADKKGESGSRGPQQPSNVQIEFSAVRPPTFAQRVDMAQRHIVETVLDADSNRESLESKQQLNVIEKEEEGRREIFYHSTSDISAVGVFVGNQQMVCSQWLICFRRFSADTFLASNQQFENTVKCCKPAAKSAWSVVEY